MSHCGNAGPYKLSGSVAMETLTEEERVLVEKSSDDVACGKRRVARSAMLIWIMCFAACLILLPELYEVVFGDLGWLKIGKTVGFVGVMLVVAVSQRQFAQYKYVSQSALLKLSRKAYCQNCGASLTVRECPNCDSHSIGS